jgi:hypothetical protein
MGTFSCQSYRISAEALADNGTSIGLPKGLPFEVPPDSLPASPRGSANSRFRSVLLLFDTLGSSDRYFLLRDLYVKHLEILSCQFVIVNCLTNPRCFCQLPRRVTSGITFQHSGLNILRHIIHSISVCLTARKGHTTAFFSTKRYRVPLFLNIWGPFQVSTPSPSNRWSETKVQYPCLLSYSR